MLNKIFYYYKFINWPTIETKDVTFKPTQDDDEGSSSSLQDKREREDGSEKSDDESEKSLDESEKVDKTEKSESN